MFNPVAAYNTDVYQDGGILTGEPVKTHPSYSPETLKQMNETRDFFLAIRQNRSNLTHEEQKISPNILYLMSLQITSKNLSDVFFVQFQMSDIFKPATYQEGTTIKKTPDMVLLQIKVYSGNSTHILDPYIYQEHSRDEEGRTLNAWVEVSKIKEIANLSEVSIIDELSLGLFNIGSVETQGNATLHSKNVLELPTGPDGKGISIGIMSDGMNHVSDAIQSGDLPSTLPSNILSEGQGDEGTATAEIIHNIAPNASLFFYAVNSTASMKKPLINWFRWVVMSSMMIILLLMSLHLKMGISPN